MEHMFMVLLHWHCVSIKASQIADKLIVYSTFGQVTTKKTSKQYITYHLKGKFTGPVDAQYNVRVVLEGILCHVVS